MFHMSNDSHLFKTREQLESADWSLDGTVFRRAEGLPNAEPRFAVYLPLYEGRFGHQFNHRFASQPNGVLTELGEDVWGNPRCFVEPQYWVPFQDSNTYLQRQNAATQSGLLGFRRVARDTDLRTCIAAIIPWGAASYGWILTFGPRPAQIAVLCGIYNSFAFDYLLRSSLGQPSIPQGSFEQIPVPTPERCEQSCSWSGRPPSTITQQQSLLPRVLELTYTAWDLEPFAQDCGYTGPPFRWDEERRSLLRAELDAAFFHLYLPADENGDWRPARKSDGCPHDESPEDLARLKASFPKPRDAVSYIMDTFPIVRRKDEEKYNGDYRTKRVILEIYDAMQQAIQTGQPAPTPLNPPPGPPTDANGNFLPPEQWDPQNWPSHVHAMRGDV
jgi:hypothetical protein